MASTTTQTATAASSPVKIVILAGLIAGTMDILAAFTQTYLTSGRGPETVLKFVASGVFGKEAFVQGWMMPAAGLFFHFVIATSWALLFFFIYPRIKPVLKNKYLLGVLYGIFVWLIMNRVVLPLSNTPPIPFNLGKAAISMSIIIACIGLPISIVTHRYRN
jgi:hypothetical protein